MVGHVLAKLTSVAVRGIEAVLLDLEVDLGRGLPGTLILGLPDKAVNESRDRVKAAVLNAGYEFPVRRITVNMAPADLKKEGPAYDLPIAVGVLQSSQQLPDDQSPTVYLGELSLDGNLRHTNGILPMVALARQRGFIKTFVPAVDAREAALVEGMQVFPVSTLGELVSHLREGRPLAVADRSHFSHRLVALGMSPREAVGAIWLLTFVIGMGALLLYHVPPEAVPLLILQAVGAFAIIALLERAARRRP